jgi:hypothetical protein
MNAFTNTLKLGLIIARRWLIEYIVEQEEKKNSCKKAPELCNV